MKCATRLGAALYTLDESPFVSHILQIDDFAIILVVRVVPIRTCRSVVQ